MRTPEEHHYAGHLIRIFIQRIGDPRVKRPRILRFDAWWVVDGTNLRGHLGEFETTYESARDEALAAARRAIDHPG